MDVDAVADQLYGLPPAEFTAARTDREKAARAAGDRALAARIHRLRRPTAAAWAANLLARTGSGEVSRLPVLGDELRRAYRELDGGRIRALTAEQRHLIPALVGTAVRLAAAAGHPVGNEARREIEQTLHAVVADEQAGRRWTSGRLDRPLAGTGLAAVTGSADGAAGGEVVEIGAAARRRPGGTTPRGTPAKRATTTRGTSAQGGTAPKRGAAAERGTSGKGATSAERAVADGNEQRATAERQLADAQAAADEAAGRVAELRAELDRGEAAQRAATDRVRVARRELARAERALQAARRSAGRSSRARRD